MFSRQLIGEQMDVIVTSFSSCIDEGLQTAVKIKRWLQSSTDMTSSPLHRNALLTMMTQFMSSAVFPCRPPTGKMNHLLGHPHFRFVTILHFGPKLLQNAAIKVGYIWLNTKYELFLVFSPKELKGDQIIWLQSAKLICQTQHLVQTTNTDMYNTLHRGLDAKWSYSIINTLWWHYSKLVPKRVQLPWNEQPEITWQLMENPSLCQCEMTLFCPMIFTLPKSYRFLPVHCSWSMGQWWTHLWSFPTVWAPLINWPSTTSRRITWGGSSKRVVGHHG